MPSTRGTGFNITTCWTFSPCTQRWRQIWYNCQILQLHMPPATSWFHFANGSIFHILTLSFRDHLNLLQFKAASHIRDRLAQEDWDQLKRHSTMFKNQIPTFNVPSYSIHVDCSTHEVVLLKASCNDLMSASLGTPESPSDKLSMTKGHRPYPNLFFLWIQEGSFGNYQGSVDINWLFAP